MVNNPIFYKMPKAHAEAFVSISKVYLETEDEFVRTQARLLMHKISDPVAFFPQKNSFSRVEALLGCLILALSFIGIIHLASIGWRL
jgi:hypothetical protein